MVSYLFSTCANEHAVAKLIFFCFCRLLSRKSREKIHRNVHYYMIIIIIIIIIGERGRKHLLKHTTRTPYLIIILMVAAVTSNAQVFNCDYNLVCVSKIVEQIANTMNGLRKKKMMKKKNIELKKTRPKSNVWIAFQRFWKRHIIVCCSSISSSKASSKNVKLLEAINLWNKVVSKKRLWILV